MNSKQKQRAVIEFLTKEGCRPSDIHRRLQNVYGDDTIDKSNVHRWMKKFKEGETSIEDKPRSGRPSTATTDTNRQRVDELIRADRRVTIRELAAQLDCGHNAIQKMVEDLGYRKVCAKWVPRQLTPDLKERRVEVCSDLLEAFEANEDTFFSDLVTGDETWAYLYDPETKNQSMEWHHTSSPRPKKFKSQRSAQKVMVTVFWDDKGVILLDFLERGRTVTSERYIETLKKLTEAIRRKRPNKNLKTIHIHHDNARPHTSLATNQAIGKLGWSVVPHPPYSPDLAPSDFHLFGPMKDSLRGQRFYDTDEVKVAVKKWVQQCTPEFFHIGFERWVQRWRKCIACDGDYVE